MLNMKILPCFCLIFVKLNFVFLLLSLYLFLLFLSWANCSAIFLFATRLWLCLEDYLQTQKRSFQLKDTFHKMDTFFSTCPFLQTVCLCLTFLMELTLCLRLAIHVSSLFEYSLLIILCWVNELSLLLQDHSLSLLKRALKQIEVIKNSRSGMPNFESHQIEANDLQISVAQYFEFRGTGKV